ncbi:MAG: pitrilysin family protein [Tenuifilaceae bacterium]|jgi:predicted Zn-dependent peptidase|nr:pitrilysin family protein [Tenuifilaceae bacterium]
MVSFDRFTLPNGLKVIIHHDSSTPLVSVNLLYNVGSKHEDPSRTGFAHLFEHLMFGGSVNIPNYDDPVERASGENNAFTSNDITNYYITLPKQNIETAFWLESDRMLSLAFSQQSLDVQKSVVIEEFNQRYLNQPYGDVWLLLRPLAYKVHPYMWPTIGKEISHIAEATLDEVKNFFYSHYAPNNAILCVAGDVQTQEIKDLANKWFGAIPSRDLVKPNISSEPQQLEQRRLEVFRKVPYDSIYIAYHMCSKLHPDFPATDLLSDILANGKSARLFQSLVKRQSLFSSIDAFITGDIDEGLFVVTGRPADGVSLQQAEEAIYRELANLTENRVGDYELSKVLNRFESTFTFGLASTTDKAMNLSYNELLGDANLLNQTVDTYRSVNAADIQRVSKHLFTPENSSVLYYCAEKS